MKTGHVFLLGVVVCLGAAQMHAAGGSNPINQGASRNAFPDSTTTEELGVNQNEWHRGKEIFSERVSTGVFSPRLVTVAAYQSGGIYYYFKNRILVAVDERSLSPKHIARINEQKILSDYFARPPLGIKESDWRRISPNSGAVVLGSDDGIPFNAYEREGIYYHFRQGVLIRKAPAMKTSEQLMRADLQRILSDYYARPLPGMTQPEWEWPIVYQNGTVSAFNVDGRFHYFKSGILVKIAPLPVTDREIFALDEVPIRAAYLQDRSKLFPGVVRPAPKPKRSDTGPARPGYDPIDSTGLGPDWERISRQNMTRE